MKAKTEAKPEPEFCKCKLSVESGSELRWTRCNLHQAAPELLEACRDALDALENEGYGGTDTAQAVKAAIRKAEGGSK